MRATQELNQLKAAMDAGLGGLTATPGLKARIESAAAGRQPAKRTALMPALCAALALVIVLSVLIPRLSSRPDAGEGALIISRPAGEETQSPETGRLLTASTLTKGGSELSLNSLWAKGGSPWPLIGVDGRWYRMLKSPSDADSKLKGDSLGTVGTYTEEPALADAGGIISNKAAEGAEVWAVNGMGGTLVMAEVDGKTRLFQRVSFNGSAILGHEGLGDVLQLSGGVSQMSLSGVGTVSGSAASDLASSLVSGADYVSAGSVKADQILQIKLDNGVTLQLLVSGERFSACGTWSNPDFFEKFAAEAE